jgi:hypothetical protein
MIVANLTGAPAVIAVVLAVVAIVILQGVKLGWRPDERPARGYQQVAPAECVFVNWLVSAQRPNTPV